MRVRKSEMAVMVNKVPGIDIGFIRVERKDISDRNMRTWDRVITDVNKIILSELNQRKPDEYGVKPH